MPSAFQSCNTLTFARCVDQRSVFHSLLREVLSILVVIFRKQLSVILFALQIAIILRILLPTARNESFTRSN